MIAIAIFCGGKSSPLGSYGEAIKVQFSISVCNTGRLVFTQNGSEKFELSLNYLLLVATTQLANLKFCCWMVGASGFRGLSNKMETNHFKNEEVNH